jgi:hypothetical protein
MRIYVNTITDLRVLVCLFCFISSFTRQRLSHTFKKDKYMCCVWRHMPIIQKLGRVKWEDNDFKDSLAYLVRPCLKIKSNKTPQNVSSAKAG